MTDDTQATRQEFEAWAEDNIPCHEVVPVLWAWQGWLAASQSIPNAVKLLENAGWTVQKPNKQQE